VTGENVQSCLEPVVTGGNRPLFMSGWGESPFDSFPGDSELEGVCALECFAQCYPLFWSVFGADSPLPPITASSVPEMDPSLNVDWLGPTAVTNELEDLFANLH
jgi:hypothetical protein